MAKERVEGDDDTVEGATAVKWHYIFKMFCCLCVCLMIGTCCVAYENRKAKEAEFGVKEHKW